MPVGRGDRRRQVERELRIGEHAFREEVRREDDLLHVRRVVGHHRRPAHFRSRAGGRGQGDEVRQRAAYRAHFRMVPGVFEDVAGVTRHQRDRLRDVECSAAAQADHRVGAVRLVGGDSFLDLAPHRVAPDAGEDADMEARKRGDDIREERQRRNAAIGDDERSLDVLALEMLRD
jgi:hypothetical protein